jgi:hypothetical protein
MRSLNASRRICMEGVPDPRRGALVEPKGQTRVLHARDGDGTDRRQP